MVLSFINVLTLLGGSREYRDQCYKDIIDLHPNLSSPSSVRNYENTTVATIKSHLKPFDTELVDIAAKYIALDFINTVNPESQVVLKDWQFCIKIRNQEVRFSDNYDYKEGCALGNIYQVNLAGGFPACLPSNSNNSK